jgi:hypothetical protein
MQAILWLKTPMQVAAGLEVKIIVGNIDTSGRVVCVDGQVIYAPFDNMITAEDIEPSTIILKNEDGSWIYGVADCRT